MATDYSAGNDVIIAKEGINTIQDLKGKIDRCRKRLVDHLLLATALTDHNIKSNEVKLVNSATNQLPQVFNSPDISRDCCLATRCRSGIKSSGRL